MERFVALDSFRGLLAVAVVLFHTYVAQAASENPLIANAYLFVEFFFVLSGFVLMHTYENRLRTLDDYRDFAISRSARILPLHLAMLGLYVLLESGRLLAEKLGIGFNDPAFSGATAPEQFLPNLLLLQSWLGEAITGSFNYPSWSISIEYYLYLVFGLLVLKGQGHQRQWFLAIALLAFVQLLFPILPLKTEIFRGLSCFFAGACTYRLYVWIKQHNQGQFGGTLLELACLIAGVAVMTSDLPVPKKGVLATLVFCVTILTFAFERGLVSSVLHQGFFVRLGVLSYSIYLCHAAVIFVFKSAFIVLGKLLHHDLTVVAPSHDVPVPFMIRYIATGSPVLDNLVVLLELGVVFAFACLTHRYIEIPGMALGKRLVRRKRTPPCCDGTIQPQR
ncbi:MULTISPECIES: acyltransferase [Pseudomonas]|uniref:Acyltransferase n=1 Tax=Pseudomonas oryzihabitans TaxID=47885 RepID=A0A178LH20_9PSED|nr:MULTISPECIES: acyltransferase [Pseudomonas]KXJ32791.1 acyltransferase [Pseudomonas sp. HUK17]MDC7830436.1 acyltransferase [Pseudomonas benzopyrenica]OAN29600.1 acyltransferase [Pseudomonas oryzihabitans]UUW71689.1 acyltransferase [Pseudomonas psychrotolerans]SEP40861.1 Peptidoglycan/LPS O-acetylase OafA/YrhL, contains acyltransferase and SGNH-hydrolase domains [Pseudomonas sp. Snoq117.2]